MIQPSLFTGATAYGPDFSGPAYVPDLDKARLSGQMVRVLILMMDGQWRTLAEIEAATGDPPASVSAQLRHLRKSRFGGHTVDKRRRGEAGRGLWEYRVITKTKETPCD